MCQDVALGVAGQRLSSQSVPLDLYLCLLTWIDVLQDTKLNLVCTLLQLAGTCETAKPKKTKHGGKLFDPPLKRKKRWDGVAIVSIGVFGWQWCIASPQTKMRSISDTDEGEKGFIGPVRGSKLLTLFLVLVCVWLLQFCSSHSAEVRKRPCMSLLWWRPGLGCFIPWSSKSWDSEPTSLSFQGGTANLLVLGQRTLWSDSAHELRGLILT